MENSRDAAMEDIVQRLEFVETRHVASLQEARALRKANLRLIPLLAGVALGAMLILILALAATKPAPALSGDVIRAKKLEIVDDAGNLRAALSVRAGAPGLTLSDEKGKIIWEAPK